MKSLSIILSFLFSFILSQEKILFVGNSFTFYWNLPSLVNEMCNYSGDIVDIYQSTAGGATLKQHWVGDKNLKTMDLLKENKYSLIILQDHSQNPILKTKESLEYFSRFIKIAKKIHPDPLFMVHGLIHQCLLKVLMVKTQLLAILYHYQRNLMFQLLL